MHASPGGRCPTHACMRATAAYDQHSGYMIVILLRDDRALLDTTCGDQRSLCLQDTCDIAKRPLVNICRQPCKCHVAMLEPVLGNPLTRSLASACSTARWPPCSLTAWRSTAHVQPQQPAAGSQMADGRSRCDPRCSGSHARGAGSVREAETRCVGRPVCTAPAAAWARRQRPPLPQ